MGCHRQKCKCFDQLTTGINVLHHLRAIIPLGRCAYGGHPHLLGVDERAEELPERDFFFSFCSCAIFGCVYRIYAIFGLR